MAVNQTAQACNLIIFGTKETSLVVNYFRHSTSWKKRVISMLKLVLSVWDAQSGIKTST